MLAKLILENNNENETLKNSDINESNFLLTCENCNGNDVELTATSQTNCYGETWIILEAKCNNCKKSFSVTCH